MFSSRMVEDSAMKMSTTGMNKNLDRSDDVYGLLHGNPKVRGLEVLKDQRINKVSTGHILISMFHN